MRKLLLVTIVISLAAQCMCAPTNAPTDEQASNEHHERNKRQVAVGFGSTPIGPIDFPVSLAGGFGYGLGGFGGIGGFGGGFGPYGGFGGRVGVTGNAPLEEIALIEGFGPTGAGPIGLGYGG